MGASRTFAISSRPSFFCNADHPLTHPGTLQASGPRTGISFRPIASALSRLQSYGERPLALSPSSLRSFAFQTIANRSPPGPQLIGSTRDSMALAQMAASMALPPAFRISTPAILAKGWLEQTTPFRQTSVERFWFRCRSTSVSRKILSLDFCVPRCPARDKLPPIKPEVQAQPASFRNERRSISFHLSICGTSGSQTTPTWSYCT